MEKERRFHLLDGLRGIAAIVVVIGHMPKGWLAGEFSYFYLAVDLFFILSGFVIAFAYERPLIHGLGVRRFLLMRYIRLYPLYILGTSIGIISATVAFSMGKGSLPFFDLIVSIPTALLMLPAPINDIVDGIFPLNPPAWSLVFELLMNFFYASILFKLSTKVIGLIVAISSLALIATIFHLQTLHTGMTWPTFVFGLGRVVFPYCCGILIFRLRSGIGQVKSSWAYCLPPSVLLVFVGFGFPAGITELVGVIVVFPLIVIAASKLDVPNPSIFQFLGAASYAVYVISVPIITLLSRAVRSQHYDEATLYPWFGYTVIIGLVVIALCLDSFDKKARSIMKAMLMPSTQSAAGVGLS